MAKASGPVLIILSSLIWFTAAANGGEVAAADENVSADSTASPSLLSTASPGRLQLTQEYLQLFPALRLEEILAYQAGMGYRVDWKNGTGLSVRGGEPEESGVFVDGVSARNRLTNIPFSGLPKGAVQSVGIRKGGFDAGYGDIRSGVVDLITKSGSRDKYSVYIDASYSQAGRKHFGPHAYDRNGTVWETFAGARAFEGIDAGEVNDPESLDRLGREWWTRFAGWDAKALEYATDISTSDDDRTPQAALELWKWRHRPIDYGNEPDYMVDVSLGGPVPGGFIPILGRFLGKTTFQASYGRERTMFPYPLTRDGYSRDRGCLKLIYAPTPSTRLTASGFYAESTTVDSSNAGRTPDSEWGTRGRPDGTWWGMERAARYFMFEQMYNDSYQPRANDYSGSIGVELTHAASPRTSYELSFGYEKWKTLQAPGRWRDTTKVKQIGGVWYDETPRNFAESISPGQDQVGIFALGDGARTSDYSSYRRLSYRIGMEHRFRRSNILSLGAEHDDLVLMNRIRGSSGLPYWCPGECYGWLLRDWEWWDGEPARTDIYLSDRLELPEFTAEVGLRVDRLDLKTHTYDLQDRFNPNYDYNRYSDSFPVRWPDMVAGKSEPRWKVSPRVAVAFRPGEHSSIYFNYGQYYQAPDYRKLYSTKVGLAAWDYPIQIANPALDWPRTASYEVGFDRLFFDSILLSLAGYYQDISRLPGMVATYSWDRKIRVMNYVSMGYADRRGFELSLRKRGGDYITGWASYEYPVYSSGVVGLDEYYQGIGMYALKINRFRDNEERLLDRSHEDQPAPRPVWRMLLDLHTPPYLGNMLGGWRMVLFHLRLPGGIPGIPQYHPRYAEYYADIEHVPHLETRLRLEKTVGRAQKLTIYCLVDNPLNRKELFDVGGTEEDLLRYQHSLRRPEGVDRIEGPGNDRWGEWNRDYIHLGFMDWYQFQHRRQFTFGVRLNVK